MNRLLFWLSLPGVILIGALLGYLATDRDGHLFPLTYEHALRFNVVYLAVVGVLAWLVLAGSWRLADRFGRR